MGFSAAAHVQKTYDSPPPKKKLVWGWFHIGWELSVFFRDSSIRLRSTPTPNFYATKSFSKVGRCALPHAPNFMKSTPGCQKRQHSQQVWYNGKLSSSCISPKIAKTAISWARRGVIRIWLGLCVALVEGHIWLYYPIQRLPSGFRQNCCFGPKFDYFGHFLTRGGG